MFFEVERTRVEIFEETNSWNSESHQFTQYISDNGQEGDRDVDDLGLEVEDLLQDGAEDGKTNA